MENIFKQLKRQAAKGLIVRVRDLKNLTHDKSSYHVGDRIEFVASVLNANPFELNDLEFYIHQLSAVQLEGNPIKIHIPHLSEGEERPVASLRGMIVENSDDAGSIYGVKDYLCRVKITGIIDLPPVRFEDVELAIINITEG